MVNFDWEKAFSNINVYTQVKLFDEILTNIFTNFVPNKSITVVDNLLKDKSKLYKQYIKNG